MKYLYLIDSAQRDKRSYPNANSFVMPISTRTNVRHAKLLRAGIFNSSYVINSTNDSIRIQLNDGTGAIDKLITLPHGDYTPDSLATEISNQVSNEFSTWTLNVTPNSRRNEFVFDSSTVNEAAFLFRVSPSRPINPVHKRLFDLLGLEQTSDLGTSVETLPFTAPRVFQVRKTRYYEIDIKEVRPIGGDDSFFVTNDETRTGLLSFDGAPIAAVDTDIQAISRLTVNLRDEWGNLVDLNGTDWHMYLELDTSEGKPC